MINHSQAMDNDDMRLQNEDIQNVTSLRKKYPELRAITWCTDVVKFFEGFLDYTDEPMEYFGEWISFLRNRNLSGIDLNWNEMSAR